MMALLVVRKKQMHPLKPHLPEMKELRCVLNETYYIDINESIC